MVGHTKVVLSDIDQTLIVNGEINDYPILLSHKISKLRQHGIFFSLISGRDLPFEKNLYKKLAEKKHMKDYEALIYEENCVQLGNGKNYITRGINKEQLSKINHLYVEEPELFNGLVFLPNSKFTIRAGWVTEEFALNKPTNEFVLSLRYPEIKSYIEQHFTNIQVGRSADGIDVISKNSDKTVGLTKYLDILKKEFKLSPKEVLVIGDSFNDLNALEQILRLGGKAGFVGTNINLQEKLASQGAYIPKSKGPLGTLETLNHFFFN